MSGVWRDEDIPKLLQGVGAIPCVIGGVSGIGTLDLADQIVVEDGLLGQVSISVTTLTVQSSAFPNVAIGQLVTVDGKSYAVRERIRYGDGGAEKILLSSGAPIVPPPDIIDGGAFDGSGGIGRSPDGGGF